MVHRRSRLGEGGVFHRVGLGVVSKGRSGLAQGRGGLHTGPASPSARASLHSKLISNRKGLWKGLGFSSTATFNTDTLAIASSGRSRGQSWGRARVWVLSGQRSSVARTRSRSLRPRSKVRISSARLLQIAGPTLRLITVHAPRLRELPLSQSWSVGLRAETPGTNPWSSLSGMREGGGTVS